MFKIDKAGAYARERYMLFFLGIVISLLFLLAYQFICSDAARDFSLSWSANFYISATLYLFIFSIVHYLCTFPAHFYGAYLLEHKFSLSNQTLLAWIKDELKKNLISLFIFLLMGNVFYLVLRTSGGLWWVWLALCWLLFTVVFTRIMPTFIIPMFYKYSDLKDASLKKRIEQIAAKSAIKLIGIFQIDFSKKTKKANAAVVGLGKSRRVILADTLLNNFSEDEIITVCAHEFGHHKLFHMPKLIGVSTLSTALGFYILNLLMRRIVLMFNAEAIYDLRIAPALMIILFLVSLIITPIQNAYSRALEKQADRFAIDMTGNPRAFVSVMDKLATMNLADRKPPVIIKHLLYDHPPISERIGMVNETEKK